MAAIREKTQHRGVWSHQLARAPARAQERRKATGAAHSQEVSSHSASGCQEISSFFCHVLLHQRSTAAEPEEQGLDPQNSAPKLLTEKTWADDFKIVSSLKYYFKIFLGLSFSKELSRKVTRLLGHTASFRRIGSSWAVAHTCNPSTGEAEAAKILSARPAWATERKLD